MGSGVSRLGRFLEEVKGTPVTGVSRRFGIGHMLVATGLFAVLFGWLQLLEAPPVGYVLSAVFCLAIPLGQVVLYQGRDPRRASWVVGSRLGLVLPAVAMAYALVKEIVEGGAIPWGLRASAEGTLGFLAGEILGALSGSIIGYAVGTVSAGIFLVLDRKRIAGKDDSEETSGAEHAAGSLAGNSAIMPNTPTGRWWLDWIAWSPLKWIWENRRHPVRIAMIMAIVATVPLTLGIPIVWDIWTVEDRQAYLIAAVFAALLIAVVLPGLLLGNWRMPPALCVVGAAGAILPVHYATQLSVWRVIDGETPSAVLVIGVGVVLGLTAAGLHGWARWMRPERKGRPGHRRRGFAWSTGLLACLTGLGLAAAWCANTPRERFLRELDRERVHTRMDSSFRVDRIHVAGRDLKEGVLQGIVNVPELASLSLTNQQISEEEMRAIGRLANLDELSLERCKLPRGALRMLDGLSALTGFRLVGIDLSDDDLLVLKLVPRLELLVIEQSRLEGSGLRFAEGLESLEQVVLVDTRVQGDALRGLAHVPFVLLVNCPVRDDDLIHLAHSDRIRGLDLSGSSITDSAFRHLGTIKGLEGLVVQETNVTGVGLADLGGLECLHGICFDDSQVGDEGLSRLPPLPSLEFLSLRNTRVTGKGFAAIKKLPKVKRLDLTGCDIGDDDLKVFYDFPLDRLTVDQTSVTEEGIAELEAAWMERCFAENESPADGDPAVNPQ